MGTRARVNVFDGNEILVSIYRQFDGYPNCLGKIVAEFSEKLKITNGISGDHTLGKTANGMGCFAAQLIKHLKEEVGNIYIRNTSEDSHGEEFVYNLSERDGKVWMTVYNGRVTWFGLPGDEEAEMNSIYAGFASEFKISENV